MNRRSVIGGLMVLFLVWLAFSFPYWGKGQVPFPTTYLATAFTPWSSTNGMPVKNGAMPDVITQIFPWKRVTVEGWKNGSIPLWNPYSFSGTSHIGTYQTAIFSPLTLLFFIIPEVHAWSIMILLQPILAGFGMFLFLRARKRSVTGATLGAIAYMFSGFLVVWMAYGTLGYAALALPYLLYGMSAFAETGSRRALAIVMGSVAFSFLSGHFQISLYVLGCGCLYLWVLGQNGTGPKRMITLLASVLVGTAIAAPQILAGADAYAKAVRSTLFLKGEVIPWQYLPTLIAPDFYGNPVTRNDWFGHYAEWSGYIGVIPFFVALVAMFAKKRLPDVLFFAILSGMSVLLAFDTPLASAMYALKVPVLGTSAASRIIVLFSFSMAALSAFGMDELRSIWIKRKGNGIAVWGIAVTLAVGLLWITLFVLRPFTPDRLSIAKHNLYLPSLIALAGLAIAWMGRVLPWKYVPVLGVLILGIAGFDSYRFAAKWMPFDPPHFLFARVPVIDKLSDLTRSGTRVFGNLGNEVGSAFGIPLIEGYDAVYQYRYGQLISAARSGTVSQVDRSVVTLDRHGTRSEALLELLGVRYLFQKKSDGRFPWAYPYWEYPTYTRIWEDDQFEIYENSAAYPRAFLVSSYVVKTEPNDILKTLFDPSFDRRNSVVLERRPGLEPSAGTGKADIVSYAPEAVRIETESESDALLVLSDAYDDGWVAMVDGKRTPLLRADYDLRAVAVPRGRHTVDMRYAPVWVTVGFWIAGFATLVGAGRIVWRKNR